MTTTSVEPTRASAVTDGWRSTLPIHLAAEMFPLMSPDELRMLGEDIMKNGLRSPIALWRADPKLPLYLLDGRNRLDAIEVATGKPVTIGAPSLMAGDFLACDKVIVLDSRVDPWAYAISANIHRRHLTAEDKRNLIVKLLKADPTKSNRQIGKMVEASHPHIAKVRRQAEKTGDVETVTTSIDTKGRKQPAARTSGRKKKTTTKREMKELKEATGKQKQRVTNDIVCLIAELINAHGKGMEMFVRQCLIEYTKEVVRACPEAPFRAMWIECARLVLKKLNIAVDEMPDIPDFLQRRL